MPSCQTVLHSLWGTTGMSSIAPILPLREPEELYSYPFSPASDVHSCHLFMIWPLSGGSIPKDKWPWSATLGSGTTVSQPGDQILPVGDYLGELMSDDHVTKLGSSGPKSYHYLQFGGKYCLKVKGLTPSATNRTRSIFLWESRGAGQGQVAWQPLGDLLGGVHSSGACSSLLTPPPPSLTSPHPKQGLICSLRKCGAWTCLLLLFNYFHSHLNFHYSFHYLLLKSIYSIYTCTYMDMYLNYKFFNIYSTYTLNRHIYTYRKWIHK